jgi:hypothetical protein
VMQAHPHWACPLPQDLLSLRPEELKCSSNPLSGLFYTHRTLLMISLCSIRKSGLTNPRTSMSIHHVCLTLVGNFPPPSGNRHLCCRDPLYSRILDSRWFSQHSPSPALLGLLLLSQLRTITTSLLAAPNTRLSNS